MKKSSSGFTLLEVLIVLGIMATLIVMTTRSIQQSLVNKEKITNQVGDTSQVRDSLKIMERDINLAFHYTDYETEMKDLIKKARLAQASTTTVPGQSTTTTVPGYNPNIGAYDPNNPNDPLNQPDTNRTDPVTQWIGKSSELYFATMNASRVREGEQVGDFIKVAYLLKSCKSLNASGNSGTSNCLIRRSSPIVEGDITQGGENVVLLENITEFKLRYFGKGRQDWVDQWDSKSGDGIARNRFPDAVEISLTMEKGEKEPKKKISMQIVVPLRFPNNTYQDQKNAAARASQQQGQQQRQGP